MAEIRSDLTVAIRVTDPAWGRRAAAVAMMVSDFCQPALIKIVGYEGGAKRQERVASGYGALLPVETPWLLSIDADSYVCGDVGRLVDAAEERECRVALRQSPLQETGRNGWSEKNYRAFFAQRCGIYRPLGTTCAFLIYVGGLLGSGVLEGVGDMRMMADRYVKNTGRAFSTAYHHAQIAFALSLCRAGILDEDTWWWEPEQLSFEGEAPGIIHHEAFSKYKFPYERALRHDK